MKRILITGGAGFIGSHLCERLLDEGNEILCLDNYFTGRKENIAQLLTNPRFELIRHDVIVPYYAEVDEIYNLACPASPVHYQYNPIKTIKTSIMGAINMLGLAKETRAKILQASTSEVYGDPIIHPQIEAYWGNVNPIGIRSCYDEGKRCAETLFMDYHRQNNIQIKIIRIFNTYGPRMHPNDGRVVSNFIMQALHDEPITIYGKGEQTRSFQYIDDLISGIVRMMNTGDDFLGPVNIGNPDEFSILELAQKIIDLTNSKSTLIFKPLPSDDPQQRKPDICLAKEKLSGWEPKIKLTEGLQKTIDYFSKMKKTTPPPPPTHIYKLNLINIVYLYAELQPYVIIVIRELVKQKGVTVHVVHWDKKRLTPYTAPDIDQVYYYNRSQFKNAKELYQMTEKIEPALIYTSGWMDKIYMAVCKKIRKTRSIPVIAGSDTKWRGGKQWLNVMAAPFLHKKCFSHIHAAGIWQYEYARRLGFSPQHILMHNLSGDVAIFHNVDIHYKKKEYPRRLLYIGRFSPVKGLNYLIDAWNSIIDKKSWILTLIGNGPEKESLIKNKDVEVLDFMSQEKLAYYMQNSGCFILPSIREPWAVVLHEAAAGGLPILASNICGTVPYFVINNYNGFTFAPGNSDKIKIAIEEIINSSTDRLLSMSYRSRKLSERITPEIVAETMLSVIQEL